MNRILITINKKWCMALLIMYAISVYIWDYTIAYKIVLVLLAGISLLVYKKHMFRLTTYGICMLVFIIYFFIHTFAGLSVRQSLSIDYLITLIINLVASFCVLSIVDSEKKIETIMRYLIGTALVIWIYVIIVDWKHVFSGSLGLTVKKPIFGGSYSHNNLPMLAGYALLFLSYFRLKKEPIKYSVIFTVFLSVCVLLSGARKALLFVLFGVLVYPLLYSGWPEKIGNRIVKIGLLLVSVVIIFYVIIANDVLYSLIGRRFMGIISGLLGGEFTESSARTRATMIRTALNVVKNNFWLGIGLNTFRTLPGSFGTWSHNNFLEILVSGGVIPFFIYYYYHLYALSKLRKLRLSPMAGMFTTYIIYLFVHDFLSISYNARNVGLMLSLSMAYLIMRRNQKDISL